MTVNKGTAIQVMGKDYHIACPQDKTNDLHAAATMLNTKMQEIKGSGKIFDNEKIAVMAAINLANELITLRKQEIWQNGELRDKLATLCNKVEKVLEIA